MKVSRMTVFQMCVAFTMGFCACHLSMWSFSRDAAPAVTLAAAPDPPRAPPRAPAPAASIAAAAPIPAPPIPPRSPHDDEFVYSVEKHLFVGQPMFPLNEAGFLDLAPDINHIKIDVGLFIGPPNAAHWLQTLPDRAVFAFEADPDTFAVMAAGFIPDWYTSMVAKNFNFLRRWWDTLWHQSRPQILKKNQDILRQWWGTRFFPFNLALADTPGIRSFHRPSQFERPSASLFEMVGKESTSVTVQTITLAQLLRYVDWERFPWIEQLKIDVQGFELPVLQGAGEYIRRVVFVTMELPSSTKGRYVGADESDDHMSDFFENLGFEMIHSEGVDIVWVNKAVPESVRSTMDYWCEYT